MSRSRRCWPPRQRAPAFGYHGSAHVGGSGGRNRLGREVHHFALLGGYGAEAIHPYLALETITQLATSCRRFPRSTKEVKRASSRRSARANKVMSKMGISTYQSYCGAQIFEAVGLNSAFLDKYLAGTASSVEGIGIFEVARRPMRTAMALAMRSQCSPARWTSAASMRSARVEAHAVDAGDHLQAAACHARQQLQHLQGIRSANQQPGRVLKTLRGLFTFKFDQRTVPDEVVEPEIVKRFATGAMSLGSISTEAHATLAIAMNRIGGKSNTARAARMPSATSRWPRAKPCSRAWANTASKSTFR